MQRNELAGAVAKIVIRIATLSSVVEVIERSLTPQILCQLDGQGASFRYASPQRIHLIVLKAARIVSSLNACTFLLARGFTQEIATILRTILDFKTTIEFLSRGNETDKEIKHYIEAYFSNFNMTKKDNIQKLPRQKKIHDRVSENIINNIGKYNFLEKFGNQNPSDLMSNMYMIFSEYVHGSYPVLTDMFSGTPARLGMYGQPNSPKDDENLECLATVLDSVELTFRLMIQTLNLQNLIAGNKQLEDWYSSFPAN